jgi:hypothetical protein
MPFLIFSSKVFYNSKETAPSKRIENNATYIKTQHAPIILQEIGLPKIREKCRGFVFL